MHQKYTKRHIANGADVVHIEGMDKPSETRKSVTLADATWREIREYGEQERIKTDAEAIRRLLQYALRRLLKKER